MPLGIRVYVSGRIIEDVLIKAVLFCIHYLMSESWPPCFSFLYLMCELNVLHDECEHLECTLFTIVFKCFISVSQLKISLKFIGLFIQ